MSAEPSNYVDLQFRTIYSIFVFSTAWLLTHLTQLGKKKRSLGVMHLCSSSLSLYAFERPALLMFFVLKRQ